MKWTCKIGWHQYFPEVNNLWHEDPKKIVFRTYMRCLHCKKWGKLVFFEKFGDRVK